MTATADCAAAVLCMLSCWLRDVGQCTGTGTGPCSACRELLCCTRNNMRIVPGCSRIILFAGDPPEPLLHPMQGIAGALLFLRGVDLLSALHQLHRAHQLVPFELRHCIPVAYNSTSQVAQGHSDC